MAYFMLCVVIVVLLVLLVCTVCDKNTYSRKLSDAMTFNGYVFAVEFNGRAIYRRDSDNGLFERGINWCINQIQHYPDKYPVGNYLAYSFHMPNADKKFSDIYFCVGDCIGLARLELPQLPQKSGE